MKLEAKRKPPPTIVSNSATFNFGQIFKFKVNFSEFDILVDFQLHL